MKINPVVKSLALVFLVYLFLFVISYSTFLQTPVIGGQVLVWQSLIEQSITWMPFVVGYAYLYRAIIKGKKRSLRGIDESKLLIPSVVLIFLVGISTGVHFSSQIIEDVLVNQKELFVYQLAFFLDEQIGHLFLLPSVLLSIIFGVLEINREQPKLTGIDIWLVNILAVLTAVATSIMSVEAGLIYLFTIPLIFLAYYSVLKLAKRNKIRLLAYPLNRYLIVVAVVTTIFSIIWWSVNGFSQPEELGLQLFVF